MKIFFFALFMILMVSIQTNAQNDTVQPLNLLDEISSSQTDSVKLLPAKMMFTQRFLWGKKGLMRNFNCFELTPEKRATELKVRRVMLVTHQITGMATLGAMIAQGIIGASLYSGNYKIKDTHEAMGSVVNALYFTTAGLALFSPPKMLDERKGYSSIKIHKALAMVHMSCIIATNILAGQIESHQELKPYHRAVAYTAFGSFAAAMIIIKF